MVGDFSKFWTICQRLGDKRCKLKKRISKKCGLRWKKENLILLTSVKQLFSSDLQQELKNTCQLCKRL